ncbi:topoisomerase II [Shewanella sp. NFH-SH190041]|uniref:DUF3802 family protein n=1 Tax=Shewanella sp. NFH-SH190041 TaxID=2950245 RepID=UPI0021C3C64F|nr:DUF3802 family protein [Shewanella sp. NFH-SH190041]BDM64521.1 topoisomerase II [Shewanella sp. NFH-SH190041]
MVTNTEGYNQLLMYLSDNLSLFETADTAMGSGPQVLAYFEQQLSAQVMQVCAQHNRLTPTQRNEVIAELDCIAADLEEIMAAAGSRTLLPEQQEFITEYAGLIKNLFDSALTAVEPPLAVFN